MVGLTSLNDSLSVSNEVEVTEQQTESDCIINSDTEFLSSEDLPTLNNLFNNNIEIEVIEQGPEENCTFGSDTEFLSLVGLSTFDNSLNSIRPIVIEVTEQQTEDNCTLNNDTAFHTLASLPVPIIREPTDVVIEALSVDGFTPSLTETSNTSESGLSKLKAKKTNKRLEKRKLVQSRSNKKLHPNPCQGKPCKNDCLSISEEERELLFNEYNQCKMYEERKNWLLNCMLEISVKRKRTKADESRRKNTVEYTVIVKGVKKKVCQQLKL